MRNKAVLLFIGALAMVLSACSSNQAADAAKESEEIEKEGKSSEGEKEKEAEEEIPEEPEKEVIKVGILLPEADAQDQELLSLKFEKAGYAPVLMIAQDAEEQLLQVQEAIKNEVAAIVVDPVDPYALSEAFVQEGEKEIPIFSYDSLVMNTEAVKYYAAFDTRAAGRLVGETIVDKKELKKAREEKRSCTIEFLMGTPEDSRELFFYNGILEVLQEYLDDGTLVCRSGKLSFDEVSVMRGSETAAKSRLQSIISEFYAEEGTPDIICTASDQYTYAVGEVLEEKGFTAEAENLPLITGSGSEAEAVKHVAEGKLGFTLFFDRAELADTCVKMVDGCITGEKAEVDNYSQYDNGKKIIGTYTSEAKLIDEDNYRILADNGTYTEEEIVPEEIIKSEIKESEETAPEPSETSEPSESPEPSKALDKSEITSGEAVKS